MKLLPGILPFLLFSAVASAQTYQTLNFSALGLNESDLDVTGDSWTSPDLGSTVMGWAGVQIRLEVLAGDTHIFLTQTLADPVNALIGGTQIVSQIGLGSESTFGTQTILSFSFVGTPPSSASPLFQVSSGLDWNNSAVLFSNNLTNTNPGIATAAGLSPVVDVGLSGYEISGTTSTSAPLVWDSTDAGPFAVHHRNLPENARTYSYSVALVTVPEPSSALLSALGIGGLLLARRRNA